MASDTQAAAGEITIVIPTLNRVELLKRAFESAVAQTTTAAIIVSDNGSDDGTSSHIDSIHDDFPSVRFLRRSSTISASAHGWFLISQVETPWMVFLSDDDWLEPSFVERVLKRIEDEPEARFVYTGCRMWFGDVAAKGRVGPATERATEFLLGFMNGERNICMCATAFRVSDLKAIGPQPEEILIGDMFYWSRILEPGGKVVCAPAELSNYVVYRPKGDSETSRTNVRHWAAESRDLADRMIGTILSEDQYFGESQAGNRARRRYIALTVSNQFVWNALRGAARPNLARAAAELAHFYLGDWKGFLRVLAAVCLPRPLLRWGVLSYARLLARRGALH